MLNRYHIKRLQNKNRIGFNFFVCLAGACSTGDLLIPSFDKAVKDINANNGADGKTK